MLFLRDFIHDYLRVIADTCGGDITLNQLRVLHFVGHYIGRGNDWASHSEICKGLGLPPATVSRAVAEEDRTRARTRLQRAR